jgi:hypothetical protein
MATTFYRVTHGAFFDTRLNAEQPANNLHTIGTDRTADLLRRLANCGADDARAVEISAGEYRDIVLSRFPHLTA